MCSMKTYLVAVFAVLCVVAFYSVPAPLSHIIGILLVCFLLVCMYFTENESQNWRQKCKDKESEIRRQGRIIDEYKRKLVQDIEDTEKTLRTHTAVSGLEEENKDGDRMSSKSECVIS